MQKGKSNSSKQEEFIPELRPYCLKLFRLVYNEEIVYEVVLLQ